MIVVPRAERRDADRADSPWGGSGGIAAGVLTALVVTAATAVLWRARGAGVAFFGTDPWFGVLVGCAAIACTRLAFAIRAVDPVVAPWAGALAVSVAAYPAAYAVLVWATVLAPPAAPVDAVAPWALAAAGGGHVLPLVLTQVVVVVAVARAGSRRPARGVVAALMGIAGVSLLLFTATPTAPDAPPPLDVVRPPLADVAPLAAVAGSWVFTALWIAWILTMAVGPVVAWRAVGRSAGAARRRLAVLAVVSLVPVGVVATCVAALPSLTSVGLGERAATLLLTALFAGVMPLTSWGAVAALRTDLEAVGRPGPSLSRPLAAAVGSLVGLGTVAFASLTAGALAPRSTAAVVLATAALVALSRPVHRTLLAGLVRRADPTSAAAAALVARDDLARSQPAAASVEVLRAVLGDPAVVVWFALPDGAGWIDVDGRPVPGPVVGGDAPRSLLRDAAGHPWACVSHPATAAADAAGPIAAVASLLDRAALEGTVRHQHRALAEGRARAERVAAEERRRLERDLHDGVQGRLLAVALQLQAAGRTTADGDTALALSDAVSALRTALEDLRRITTGSGPEILGRRGLSAALGDLVRRMPVPVTLSVPDARMDPRVETTAYLVVAEALTNALKHAGPCTVDVALTVGGPAVLVRVADDGAGGADLRIGTGLRGLQERVGAVGGTLLVADRRPSGTLVEAVLPCEP